MNAIRKHFESLYGFAIIAVLSAVLLTCVSAMRSPAADVTDVVNEDTPVYTVTIRHLGPDGEELAPPKTYSVPAGGKFFTADEGDAELTIQPLDGDGQEDGEPETVTLSAGQCYAVGVFYPDAEHSDPSPLPEYPATSAPSVAPVEQSAKSPAELKGLMMNKAEEEPHETIDSMLRSGKLKPYLIPGFGAKGPFWEKYGYLLSDEDQQRLKLNKTDAASDEAAEVAETEAADITSDASAANLHTAIVVDIANARNTKPLTTEPCDPTPSGAYCPYCAAAKENAPSVIVDADGSHWHTTSTICISGAHHEVPLMTEPGTERSVETIAC